MCMYKYKGKFFLAAVQLLPSRVLCTLGWRPDRLTLCISKKSKCGAKKQFPELV